MGHSVRNKVQFAYHKRQAKKLGWKSGSFDRKTGKRIYNTDTNKTVKRNKKRKRRKKRKSHK